MRANAGKMLYYHEDHVWSRGEHQTTQGKIFGYKWTFLI